VTVVEQLNRRFARFVTDVVVRRPRLWRVLRRPLASMFDRLAPKWNRILQADHLAPLDAALDALTEAPRRVLDLGTGTGAAAVAVAHRWPEAEVVGVDVAEQMIETARQDLPAELDGRVRFEVGDAARLSFPDGAFDLVTLANAIPFFDELARVVAPGGSVVFAFSGGAGTPIYIPSDRLRNELSRRGFGNFAEFDTGRGTAFLATRSRLS
jgi:ubiquinone/menaquinone biosynthesis C-methylase UbiE